MPDNQRDPDEKGNRSEKILPGRVRIQNAQQSWHRHFYIAGSSF